MKLTLIKAIYKKTPIYPFICIVFVNLNSIIPLSLLIILFVRKLENFFDIITLSKIKRP